MGWEDALAGFLPDLLGLGGAVADAAGTFAPALTEAAPAAIDLANPALTAGQSFAEPAANAMSSFSLQQPDMDLPFKPGEASGLGSELSSGQIEQANPGSVNPANSKMGLPPSPTQSWRESVGAIPGKWYDAFQRAPGAIADYVGNNPAKVGAMAVGVGAGLANMGAGGANEPGMPPRPSEPRPAPDPGLPKSGPPSSPLLGPGVKTKGRGGFAVS